MDIVEKIHEFSLSRKRIVEKIHEFSLPRKPIVEKIPEFSLHQNVPTKFVKEPESFESASESV